MMRERARGSRDGFSLLEVIVSLVVGIIVLGSVVQVMIGQGRGYRKQREVVDVRETGRQAAALFAWDLRQAVIADGPFAAIGTNSVAIRSPRGTGTICARHPSLPRFGLWKTAGTFSAADTDTAVVYAIGRGKWKTLKITAVGTPQDMGVTACAWPGARPPDVVVQFAVTTKTDTSWIRVGAPIRTFQRVEYAQFEQDSRWWLGRKIGAAESYERLTGPLLPPSSNGLAFIYYDTLGAETADPGAVGSVEVTLRTESYSKTAVGDGFDHQRDSLVTKVAIRR